MNECGDEVDYDLYEVAHVNASDCNCSLPEHMYVTQCDCEYPQSEAPPMNEVLPIGLVYAVVFCLGTIGNFLVIIVITRYKRMHNVTNVFLASLSTADLCLILFCVPVQYMKYLSYDWALGSFMCYALHYVQGFTMFCSVLTLTAMSIERYFAIVFPMMSFGLRSVGRARRIIFIIWIVAGLMAIPNIAVGTKVDRGHSQKGVEYMLCLRNEGNFTRAYSIYQFLAVLACPSATMMFCYASITYVLYFSEKESAAVKSSEVSSSDSPMYKSIRKSDAVTIRKSSKGNECQTKKQVTQMLIAVVLLFILCWTPFVVDDLLSAYSIVCQRSLSESMKYMRMAFALMAYCNSCVNPVVYAFMCKRE